MYEKYNAFEVGVGGGGGEYVPQVGFGWSNAVALVLLQQLYVLPTTATAAMATTMANTNANAQSLTSSPSSSSSSHSSSVYSVESGIGAGGADGTGSSGTSLLSDREYSIVVYVLLSVTVTVFTVIIASTLYITYSKRQSGVPKTSRPRRGGGTAACNSECASLLSPAVGNNNSKNVINGRSDGSPGEKDDFDDFSEHGSVSDGATNTNSSGSRMSLNLDEWLLGSSIATYHRFERGVSGGSFSSMRMSGDAVADQYFYDNTADL
mmetsp:Transcript_28963/g.48641  ORF Transcript_28963/g.48641 Transcript_28963/m.48641 type:complete len:265 (-) Transcript_28963:214-1008(-)